jgi:hypothetical protein
MLRRVDWQKLTEVSGGDRPEDARSKQHWNVGQFLPDYAAIS